MQTGTVELGSGYVTIMDFGGIRVHVYDTRDAIDDRVILLERDGRGVVIELPCFRTSIEEMTSYIRDAGIEVEGRLVSYHAAGDFLPEVKAYMTEGAHKYNTAGAGKGLIDGFAAAFGDDFDRTFVSDWERIGAGELTIAGIDMVINPDSEAYEVEVPAIKTVYLHMLGHDCHSIVAGPGHADAIIANLRGYLDRGYELFLSSHYGPETREDVETKIAYLGALKDIAASSSSAEEFVARMDERFPGYSGAKYLGMTAGMFFPQ